MNITDFIKFNLFPPKNPNEIARVMTEKIAKHAFDMFKNKDFRQLNNFEKIDQIEQDRIFNEIIVSGVVLAIFIFEKLRDASQNKKFDQFYSEMQMELESSYGNWLRDLGAQEEHASLFKDLIKMRLKEYQKNYHKFQKEVQKRVDTKFPYLFIVAIGGSTHIARNKNKLVEDNLKPFTKWCTLLTDDMLKILHKIIKK
jgi:hypothetical protein